MYNNYTDSVNLRATVQPGMTYPISLSVIWGGSFNYTGYCNVFIDYNRNGNWDLPDELVFGGNYDATTISTIIGNVTVPYTAIPGLTRMRVVVRESGNATTTTPCGTYGWGETEDYTVRIIPPIPHDGGISKIGIGAFIPYTTVNPISTWFNVRNYGSDTLASATVNYTINGGTVVQLPWSKTPALQSLEIDTNYNQPVSLVYGFNNIVAYTSGIAGDTNYNNDTATVKVFKEYSTTPPYADNFEVNKYWFPTDTVNGSVVTNLWAQGIPTSIHPSLNTAPSPVNAWVTDLSANYPVSNTSILYTPVFDIITMQPDTLKFWQWRQFGTGTTGRIEYKNNNNVWTLLGDSSTNWYNTSTGWTGIDTTWKLFKYCVKDLVTLGNLGNTVQFRYIFTSGTSTTTMKGWAIDDFELTLAQIPNDAGVTAINTPTSTSLVGDQVTVNITVRNFGTNTLTNIPVKYQVGTGTIVGETIAVPLAPGAIANYTFTQTFQVGTQAYNICAWTAVIGDFYTQNDDTCKHVTVSPAANDVGVTQILQPNVSVSQGGSSVVIVVIKNYGSTTQTSIPVTFARSGSSVQPFVNGTWTGSLAPGASTIYYTFPTNLLLPSAGTSFNLCAYTSLATDAYRLNDTLCKSVTICNTVSAAGTITGPASVLPGSTQTYSVATIAGATSYNWVYYPSTGITITGQGTSTITITFGAGAATNGILVVNGVGATCSGTPNYKLIALGVGINDFDANDLWLGQNMPNPTTGLTNIEYSLPTAGNVKFDIVNLYGQNVYSINEKVDAGKHLIDLNVKDLAAGIYYYAIEFKGKRLVKKMIVNK